MLLIIFIIFFLYIIYISDKFTFTLIQVQNTKTEIKMNTHKIKCKGNSKY